MSQTQHNDLFKKQRDKLNRATFKKGFINAVNLNSTTADVYFAESNQTIVKNIPLASHIITDQIMIGDKCRVDVFDETNPNDMVIAYVYGRTIPYQKKVQFMTGNLSLNLISGSGTIAHGLGVIPDVFGIWPFIGQAGYSSIDYPLATGADASNIDWTSSSTNTFVTAYWFAIKFT